MDELRAQGEVPYLIPLGESTPPGAAAYATAVPELAGQLGGQPATHLVVAAGSLGSMAGARPTARASLSFTAPARTPGPAAVHVWREGEGVARRSDWLGQCCRDAAAL